MTGLATATRQTAPPIGPAEQNDLTKALDLADIADADAKAEIERLRAELASRDTELSTLRNKTTRDDNFRARLRQLRDEEETLKTRCAEKRAAIKECVDEWLKGWSPGLFDTRAPTEANGHAEPAVQPDDSWRQLPCGALQEVPDDPISASLIVKLADNEVSTLGQLSDRMNAATEKGGQWFDTFAGIGPGKAEEIEKALDSFWKSNPKYCRSAANQVVEAAADALKVGGIDATAHLAPDSEAGDDGEETEEDGDEGREE